MSQEPQSPRLLLFQPCSVKMCLDSYQHIHMILLELPMRVKPLTTKGPCCCQPRRCACTSQDPLIIASRRSNTRVTLLRVQAHDLGVR